MYAELAFAQRAMREKIAPSGGGISKGERLQKAARRLKWNASRARDVWYADERVSLKAAELRQIEEISGLKFHEQQELSDIDDILARADALLVGEDTDFLRPFVAAIHEMCRVVARSRAAR